MILDAFMPLITPEVIGCPDPLIRQTLIRSAVEFCQRTFAWTEFQDPYHLVSGQRDYELDYPSASQVYALRDVFINGRRIEAQPLQRIAELLPQWELRGSNEPIFYNAVVGKKEISLYPTPVFTGTAPAMTIRASYEPTPTANSLPDFLGGQYLTAVTAGAKARLMTIPGQAWSNPALAQYYSGVFEEGVLNAKSDILRDGVHSSIRVQPRAFGF